MTQLSTRMKHDIQQLEEGFRHAGASIELEVARAFAAKGKTAAEIDFLMRGVFSRRALDLLVAEAQDNEGRKERAAGKVPAARR